MLTVNLSKNEKEIIFKEQENYLSNHMVNFLMANKPIRFTHNVALLKGHDRERSKEISYLNYNVMLNRGVQDISEVPVIENLLAQKVHFNELAELNMDFQKKRRAYDSFNQPIAEHKETNAYARSYANVVTLFGGVLHDTTKLFEYQIECAALIGSRKRLLNGMDMGLGSAKRSV